MKTRLQQASEIIVVTRLSGSFLQDAHSHARMSIVITPYPTMITAYTVCHNCAYLSWTDLSQFSLNVLKAKLTKYRDLNHFPRLEAFKKKKIQLKLLNLSNEQLTIFF